MIDWSVRVIAAAVAVTAVLSAAYMFWRDSPHHGRRQRERRLQKALDEADRVLQEQADHDDVYRPRQKKRTIQ